jgi:hypothetical protein
MQLPKPVKVYLGDIAGPGQNAPGPDVGVA